MTRCFERQFNNESIRVKEELQEQQKELMQALQQQTVKVAGLQTENSAMKKELMEALHQQKTVKEEVAGLQAENSELMDVKSENDHFKRQETQLEEKLRELEQDALNAKEANDKQQEELHVTKKELWAVGAEECNLQNERRAARAQVGKRKNESDGW